MKTIKSSNNNVQNWQRKLIFGITSIVMISFVVFTMNSCNKEIETVTPDSQLSINQDPTARVKAFKEMLKSQEEGNLELRTTYTAEELIWNVEANINYTYGEAGLKYDDYAVLTDTIDIPELGGPMPSTVVARVNDDVLDIIKCFYHDTGFPNKKLKLVDVFPIGGQNAVGMTVIVGNVNLAFGGGDFIFEPGDDWDAFRGTCIDLYNPSNGANEVAKATNNNVGTSSNISNEWIFINIEGIWYDEDDRDNNYWFGNNANDPIPGDMIIDYHLWQSNSDDPDVMCLEHDEMNYYLGHAKYEALKFEPILNKTFMHIIMLPDVIPGLEIFQPEESPNNTAVWRGNGYYGIKYIVEVSEPKLELAPCDY